MARSGNGLDDESGDGRLRAQSICSSNPRSITVTPPVEIYVGIKATLDEAPPPAPPLVTAKY